MFEEYHWPGNLRELENVINRAMVLCQKDYLSYECCSGFPVSKSTSKSDKEMENYLLRAIDSIFLHPNNDVYQKFLSSAEKLLIKRAVEITNGNQVQAARLLGISRTTLRNKLFREISHNIRLEE